MIWFSPPGWECFTQALARQRERDDNIRRANLKYEFERLKKGVIRPTLRELMAKLHSQGHGLRLQDFGERGTRFDFTLDAAKVVKCTLEIDLGNRGEVVFTFFKNMDQVAQHTAPVEDLTSDLMSSKVSLLLRSGLSGS